MGKEKEKKSKLDEMLGIYKTESAIGSEERREMDAKKIEDYIEDNVLKYLTKKHGSDKELGTPNKYSINGHDEAHEIVIEMAKAALRKKGLSAGAVAELAKNEALLLDQFDIAVGRKGYAHDIAAALAENPENITTNRQYLGIKQALGQHCANHKLDHAKSYLEKNLDARGKIEGIVNSAASTHGKEVKKVSQERLVQHLGASYRGNGALEHSYVQKDYKADFKGLPKKK